MGTKYRASSITGASVAASSNLIRYVPKIYDNRTSKLTGVFVNTTQASVLKTILSSKPEMAVDQLARNHKKRPLVAQRMVKKIQISFNWLIR